MDQPTFSDLEYQGKKRKTRRELFLERNGRPDSLAVARGPHPPLLPQGREGGDSPTHCRSC